MNPTNEHKLLDVVLTTLRSLTSDQDLINPIINNITGCPHSILELLPNTFKHAYLTELKTITDTIDSALRLNAEHLKAIEALNFEKTKLINLMQQGHSISTTAIKIASKQTYHRYNKKIHTKDAIYSEPIEVSKILIQNDVPLLKRSKGIEKPYIYETKYYPSTKFGTRGKDLNQLLKYQKAFDMDLIAGVTLDIKGCISNDFIKWILNKNLTPGIQIIYTLDLPSGNSYSTEIRAANNNENSIFITHNDAYTSEDLRLIDIFEDLKKDPLNLQHVVGLSLEPDDIQNAEIKQVLTGLNVNGKTWLEQPYEIRDAHIYTMYITEQQHKIWNLISTYYPNQIPTFECAV